MFNSGDEENFIVKSRLAFQFFTANDPENIDPTAIAAIWKHQDLSALKGILQFLANFFEEIAIAVDERCR